MKKTALTLALMIVGVALPAAAQHQVSLSDKEIDQQLRLNNLACKMVGLDDGAQTCAMALALSDKLVAARAPKVAEKVDKPEPPAADKKN